MLKEGDKAPDFSVPNQDGSLVSSKDLKGQKYVIYFYPKDNTPGCTAQACSIRDDYKEFKKLGVPVFGVSKDSQASHQKFREKYELPFPLLVDTELEMAKQFGAYGKKNRFGKVGYGILRSSFIVNEKGVIEKTFPKVNTKIHATELLEALKK